MTQRGNDTDVCGELVSRFEVGEVAEFSDQARRGRGSDTVDRGEQATNLVTLECVFDIDIEVLHASSQRVDVLAHEAHLHAIDLAVMLSDRALGEFDQARRELLVDTSSILVPQSGQPTHRRVAQ